jgi:hypothetical protein
MRFLHVLAAAAVGASACQPRPAQAYSLTTAAWASAASICQVMAAGFSMPEAVRIGITDNLMLWSAEMQHPAFSRLMAAEVVRRCPDLLRSAPGGGTQL